MKEVFLNDQVIAICGIIAILILALFQSRYLRKRKPFTYNVDPVDESLIEAEKQLEQEIIHFHHKNGKKVTACGLKRKIGIWFLPITLEDVEEINCKNCKRTNVYKKVKNNRR